MKKLLLSIFMIVALMSLAACKGEAKVSEAKEDTKVVEKEKLVIIDQNDREVEIPDSINRVATGRILPFPAVYFLANGSTDEIVGIHPASKSAAKESMLGKMSPSILEADTSFLNGGELNVEELLRLDTDIVFVYGDNGHKIDVYEKAGINAIGIKTMSLFGGDSIETLNSWLELLGEISGNQAKAMEIIDYGKEVEADINDKLQGIEKVKGLMIFTQTDGKNVVSGKGFFGNYWLNSTGAKDLAEDEIKIKAVVDMEQIYTWDPEVLYITNFTSLQPEDFYENKIPGQDWSEVSAVKNKRVHKIPLGIYRWFPPSGDSPLMLQWLAQKNHPELFDYDMNSVISAYYEKYYGYSLTEEEINMILNPSEESAKGYND
ncbi:MAG: ABC transporter substrate-binding protein [Firmicutes bacterium]|nr:ABC transporter substrate-binding protein [Bacillota bacterium]